MNTLFSDLAFLKAELHSINVDLGVPTYRRFAIRKAYLPEDEIIPDLKDYIVYPDCKITSLPQRYVNDTLSNGSVILSQDDLLIHNLPRIYPLDFLKENIEFYILDPVIGENNDWQPTIVDGIRCELLDVRDDSALHWKILLRKIPDRNSIAPAPLRILTANSDLTETVISEATLLTTEEGYALTTEGGLVLTF